MFFYHDGNDDRKVFLLPDCFREKHLNEDDLKTHLDQFQNHSDEEEMDSYIWNCSKVGFLGIGTSHDTVHGTVSWSPW